MNNYFAGNAVCVKLMDKLGCCVQKVKKACHMKKEGSAVIGEVLVMIVVVAMAALFKSGGLKFIQENHGIYDVFIKFMKSAWKKKKSGVGNMLSCMLGMLFLVMVMYLGLDMYARVNMAVNKSRIERTYILYMETYGYLTPEKRDRLTKELSDMGVSNISYAGTTMSMAGYGQEIVLSVTGILRMNSIAEVGRNFVFVRGGEENFRIYQKSTAKNIQD